MRSCLVMSPNPWKVNGKLLSSGAKLSIRVATSSHLPGRATASRLCIHNSAYAWRTVGGCFSCGKLPTWKMPAAASGLRLPRSISAYSAASPGEGNDDGIGGALRSGGDAAEYALMLLGNRNP